MIPVLRVRKGKVCQNSNVSAVPSELRTARRTAGFILTHFLLSAYKVPDLFLAADCCFLNGQTLLVACDVGVESGHVFGHRQNFCTGVAGKYLLVQEVG